MQRVSRQTKGRRSVRADRVLGIPKFIGNEKKRERIGKEILVTTNIRNLSISMVGGGKHNQQESVPGTQESYYKGCNLTRSNT